MTIENIVCQYPKTDNCELQTLGELRAWQIEEFKKFVCGFADWYCNGISNSERKSPEKMLEIYNKIP